MQVARSSRGGSASALRMRCPVCLAVFRTGFDCCPADGSALAPSDRQADPLVGSELAGRYVIEALVGEGSMGLIYRARHTCLPRAFAVKILFGDLIADPRMRIRFAQEASLASRLSHPHVVPVVDFGRSDQGLLYLVMDFIEGEGLGELMAREAPLDPLHAIDLTRKLAQGLGHAHRRGLVHRDFKPNNVLLERHEDAPPVPRILDFGLAISTHDRDELPGRLTEFGYILGTPIYIAPEQVLDQTVDHRADLFALGVVLYEMLAGRPPFDGRPVEIAHKNVIQPVPPIAQRSPGVTVPHALELVMRRLLEKSPGDRFASAEQLVAALDDAEHHLLVERGHLIAPPFQAPRSASRMSHAVAAPLPRPAREPAGPSWNAWLSARLSRRTLRVARSAAAGLFMAAASALAFGVADRTETGALRADLSALSAGAPRSAEAAPRPAVAASHEPKVTPLVTPEPVRAIDAQPAPQDAPAASSAAPASRSTSPRAVSRAGGDLSGRAEKASADEKAADPELSAAASAGRAAVATREVSARARDEAPFAGPRGFGLDPPKPVAPPARAQVKTDVAPARPAIAAPRPRGPIVVPPHRARREGRVPLIRLPHWEKAPGQVAAKLCIDTRGEVTSVVVLTSVSSTVRDRVSRALSRSRYQPVVEAGAPVAACFATVFRVQVE